MIRAIISKVKRFRRPLHSVVATNEYQSTMKAFVKKPNGGERAEISLEYVLPSGVSRTFNFSRPVAEELGVAVNRMAENISKQVNKQAKKKKKKNAGDPPPEIPIDVKILKNGFELPQSLSVLEAFADDTSLVINDVSYEICVNVPKVTALQLPNNIMAGFEYFPSVAMEYGDSRLSDFEWFKEDASDATETAEAEPKVNWVKAHSGFSFVPQNADVGKKLKLLCIPKSDSKSGEAVEVISECEVTPSPGFCPFMTRHAFTKERATGFRTVSYNLLADYYADSDFSREHLFPYCPPYALHIDYRKPLFTTELVGYNADIICLQECDVKVFLDQLLPILDLHGLEGVMKRKGNTAEGTAVFFARDKFKMVVSEDMQISDYIKECDSLKEIYEKINTKEALKERIESRQTSLQTVLLESCEDPNQRVLVATTHLFWHPTAGHVRALQAAACLAFIQELLPKYSVNGKTPAIVFAGDFNSVPTCGATKLLSEGVMTPDHCDWMRGGEEEYVEGIELKHSLNLTSACGFPKFTNYTAGFKECLDYIYVTPELEVEQVIPLPSEEELSLHVAIPNVVFPSDHLALVCDLKWK